MRLLRNLNQNNIVQPRLSNQHLNMLRKKSTKLLSDQRQTESPAQKIEMEVKDDIVMEEQ